VKVGVLQFFGWADRKIPLESIFERAIERFEIMDDTGYDAVWLAEHHFSSFSVCPSVHMMATMAAAQTERLRIGTAVSLAPFYHPLRLAEEVALLDVLSGGRVNWGAGRAFIRAARTVSRTKSCITVDWRKRTSVFEGWTLTSTSPGGISKKSSTTG